MRSIHRIVAALALFAGVWSGVQPASAQSSGPDAFAIEALNTGLGPAPDRLDRTTPRATLEAFLRATNRTDYQTAAHLLDLDAVPEAQQATEGPELARKLARVMERKVPISFESIPDRPDAMRTEGSSREPMVGEPRKSLALGSLDLAPWPVTIRLNRVQVGEENPVWVFSRQSVEHVDQLYARYGPTQFERWLPDLLKGEAFAGLMWWEVIAVPLILALAAIIGFALWRIFGIVSRNQPSEVVGTAVRRARLPVVLLVLALYLEAVIENVFVFSSGAEMFVNLTFWTLVLVAIVVAASRVFDTIIDFTSDRYISDIADPENTGARRWFTNLSAVKRVGIILVVVIGVALAVNSLDVFSSFGLSLLVTAGVATAIMGLAAQTILGNIFASLQLAFAKPIRIGDAVLYEDQWAHVERINYTYVQLKTWDMKRFIVPVKHFVSNPFENWTKEEPKMIKPVLLKLDHRADVEALRRKFAEIAAEDPDWSEGEEPKVLVIDQDEDGIAVRFYCVADNPSAAWDLHCRVRERMVAFLREMDEPSDLPRTRIAYVQDATGEGTGAPRTDDEGARDSGEPKQKTLGEAAE